MLHPCSSLGGLHERPPSSNGPLRPDIEEAIERFGSASLTKRERDVIKLVLRGLPSKLIARELKIAPKTENVHRRNAYAKLEVDARSALFFQFLQSLSEIETPTPGLPKPGLASQELRRMGRESASMLSSCSTCSHFGLT